MQDSESITSMCLFAILLLVSSEKLQAFKAQDIMILASFVRELQGVLCEKVASLALCCWLFLRELGAKIVYDPSLGFLLC